MRVKTTIREFTPGGLEIAKIIDSYDKSDWYSYQSKDKKYQFTRHKNEFFESGFSYGSEEECKDASYIDWCNVQYNILNKKL